MALNSPESWSGMFRLSRSPHLGTGTSPFWKADRAPIIEIHHVALDSPEECAKRLVPERANGLLDWVMEADFWRDLRGYSRSCRFRLRWREVEMDG